MPAYNEPRIKNDDTIIRRISPHYVVPDQNNGGERISTMAFKASSGENGGMSVDILALIEAANEVATSFVTKPPFTGAVSFPARAGREAGLWVGYEPLPDNPFHGEVWRPPSGGKFTGAQSEALLQAAEWFVEMPGVSIPKK